MEYVCFGPEGEFGRGSNPQEAYDEMVSNHGIYCVPGDCDCDFYEMKEVKVEMRLTLMPSK